MKRVELINQMKLNLKFTGANVACIPVNTVTFEPSGLFGWTCWTKLDFWNLNFQYLFGIDGAKPLLVSPHAKGENEAKPLVMMYFLL